MAARVAKEKPIILLRSARTTAGRSAARFPTASTPAPDKEVTRACRQSGIVRADTVPEFMNYAKGFDYQPAPQGRNVAILSLSGANAVMASDYVTQSSMETANPSNETLERVKELVPDWQTIRNPIDQWLALPSGSRETQEVPLNAVLEGENVDAVITIHLASEAPDFDGVGDVYEQATSAHPDKPVLSYIMGAEIKDQWLRSMEGSGVPVFDSAYEVVDTLDAMYRWYRYANGYQDYDTSISEGGNTV